MLEQPRGLLLNELSYHVTENSSYSIESLVSSANVVETMVIEKDLLDNEDSHSLAELGASLHDSETERDDLCSQKKVDHI